MYKSEYQGGPSVEILSAQGKDPLSKWKISGGHNAVKRVYEKDVKSFVFYLEGSAATSKLQLPKDGTKQALYLTQRYLTMQVYIPSGKDFSVELVMTDDSNSKRRLVISTSIREMSITPLHSKLSLSMVKRDSWLNLCFDLVSLLSDIFLRQSFKSLDCIVLSGNCKVRRIFTMRNRPPDTTDDADFVGSCDVETADSLVENIPPSLQFANTVPYATQVLTVRKITSLNPRKTDVRDTSGYWSSSSDDLNLGRGQRRLSARDQPQPVTHIAFGTRVQLDTGIGLQSGNKSSRSSKNSARRERKTSTSSVVSQTSRSSVNNIPAFKKTLKPILLGEKGNENNNSNQNCLGALEHNGISGSSMAVPSPPTSAKSRNHIRKPRILNRVRSPSTRTDNFQWRELSDSVQGLPSSLAKLVDDIELSDRNDSSPTDPKLLLDNSIFTFSSRPHSAPRKKDDVLSQDFLLDRKISAVSSKDLEEDFIKSDDSDSDKDMVERIFESTPSPRPDNSIDTSPVSYLKRAEHRERLDVLPEMMTSRNQLYDSTKYTSDYKDLRSNNATNQNVSSVEHKAQCLQKSLTSLRGSDVTLTASVDTLVRNSVVKEDSGTEPEDSLEESHRRSDKTDNENSNITKAPSNSTFSPHRPDENTSEDSLHPDGNTSHRSVTVSRKSLREIPQNSARASEISPRFANSYPESRSFQVGSWSESFEEQMLASLKREQEDEMRMEEKIKNGTVPANAGNLTYEDNLSGDESFDASWSTWKQPVTMPSNAYKTEMEGALSNKNMDTLAFSLGQSNPRDWGNVFSPPIVLPSERAKQEKEILSDVESAASASDMLGFSDGSTVSRQSANSSSAQESDDEEMLDLMYDPCLNCYFDPKSGRYYELKG